MNRRPRRPVRQNRPRGKREPNGEPFDKWLSDALALRRRDPERYDKETKPQVKILVENFERVTKNG